MKSIYKLMLLAPLGFALSSCALAQAGGAVLNTPGALFKGLTGTASRTLGDANTPSIQPLDTKTQQQLDAVLKPTPLFDTPTTVDYHSITLAHVASDTYML